MIDNRREYFRISLTRPLCGDVSISTVGEKQINSAKTKICINDIGPGGLRFFSTLKLTPSPIVTYEIGFKILGKTMTKMMTILRMESGNEVDGYYYGAKFNDGYAPSKQLMQELNRLSIFVQRKEILYTCAQCPFDTYPCAKQKITTKK